MTQLEYSFLRRWEKLGCPHRGRLSPEDQAVYAVCKSAKYIETIIGQDDVWRHQISLPGKAAMLQFEQDLKDLGEQRAREESAKRAEHAAQRAQAVHDKKKDRRHDLFVAAFGCVVTIFLEHIGDFIDFIKILFK